MASHIVEVELDARDWGALQMYLQGRLLRGQSRRERLIEVLIVTGFVAIVMFAMRELVPRFQPVSLLAGVVVGLVCIILISRQRLKRVRPSPDSPIFSRTRRQFDAAGMASSRSGESSFVAWSNVLGVDETAEYVFLPIDRAMAYVIPKRALPAGSSEQFVAQLREWHAASASRTASGEVTLPTGDEAASISDASQAAEPMPAPVSHVPVARGFLAGLRSNLRAGLRVLCLRRVEPREFAPTFDQVAALFAITLVVAGALDWVSAGEDTEFMYYGLYSWFAYMIFGVWACALTARMLSPTADTRALLTATLAVAPYAVGILWLLSLVPQIAENYELEAWVSPAVVFIIGVPAVRAAYGFMRPGALLIVMLSLVGVGLARDYLSLDAGLWAPASDEDYSESVLADRSATESLLFNEPARIAEAVDRIEAERPGVTDVFYMGFGGDGLQRVFRREALLGERSFAARMGSGTRSLELINDYQDRISYPLATVSGLRHGLQLIADRMNPDEDILVLLLTSHGSQEDGIYVRNGLLPVDDSLPPDTVSAALDAAGIKWRIVIVSACYSGVFLELLESPNTLVITAADADNTSFGCADHRDLTYFGEAFLRDALPKATSLEGAFEVARAAIGQREKAEKLTPSNPQMFVGDAMREKLAGLGPFPLRSESPPPADQRLPKH